MTPTPKDRLIRLRNHLLDDAETLLGRAQFHNERWDRAHGMLGDLPEGPPEEDTPERVDELNKNMAYHALAQRRANRDLARSAAAAATIEQAIAARAQAAIISAWMPDLLRE